jgi:predicted transcriptional regulator
MSIIVQSQNAITSAEAVPDGLRAEIGSYYTPGEDFLETFSSFNEKINKNKVFFESVESNEQVLIAKSKTRIFISGDPSQFRNQDEWRNYVNRTIPMGSNILDHKCDYNIGEISSSFVKNFHNPQYEDLTKTFPSNELLNYNLISYPHKAKAESVRRVGDLVTIYDDDSYLVTRGGIDNLFDQFSNRVVNFIGSSSEISTKQRNIFKLNGMSETTAITENRFPFYYTKSLPRQGRTNLASLVFENEKLKNIMQAVKRDLTFSSDAFYIAGDIKTVKSHDLIRIATSTNIIRFDEGSDEIFLLPESEVETMHLGGRFLDQVSAVRFLSRFRSIIAAEVRTYQETIESTESSRTFLLGYKIEKYLDNDAGQPIQTYYTNDLDFIDTQLKYGRKYIYKTKVLLGVIGTSYKYSSLFVSQDDASMVGIDGNVTEDNPSGLVNIASEKYRAYVDADVTPSFRLLEIPAEEHITAFVDTPTLPPSAEIYNQKNKSSIEVILKPSFFKVESVTSEDDQELMRSLVPLTSSDRDIVRLLDISGDRAVDPMYFTGIYEVFRMSTPPDSLQDFSDYYLTTVDMSSRVAFNPPNPSMMQNNNVAHFEDRLVPNKKYYYIFRAITYHGTPSNPTNIYEMELLRDADEFKLNVSEFIPPTPASYTFMKNAKRLIRITPNIERLLFTHIENEEINKNNWTLDNGSLVVDSGLRSFKVRITSKHTGKKIDLNINFTISKDDSFNVIQ